MIEDLKSRLRLEEGKRQSPYLDTRNKITIGIGRNLTDTGLSDSEIEMLFQNDIERVIRELDSIFPDARTFFERHQIALLDMLFHLGKTRFLRFEKMIACIRIDHWEGAKREALDSKWARDFPQRAKSVTDLFDEPTNPALR